MRTLKIIIAIFFLILLVSIPVLWQRNERDYTLSEAVSNQDYARAEKLLRDGANPDVPWSGYNFREQLYFFLGRDPWSGGPLTRKYNLVNYTNDSKMKALLLKYGAKP